MFDLNKAEDRKAAVTWLLSAHEAIFDHREVIVLINIDYNWMNNWSKRGFCPPLKVSDGPAYTGKKLVTVATAARLVEQGLTPSASFATARLICEKMLTKYRDEPTGMPDWRDYVAVVHVAPARVTGFRKKVLIDIGPPSEVFARPLSLPAYLVVAIGRIWFDIAARAHAGKQEQLTELDGRSNNNPDYDPYLQAHELMALARQPSVKQRPRARWGESKAPRRSEATHPQEGPNVMTS